MYTCAQSSRAERVTKSKRRQQLPRTMRSVRWRHWLQNVARVLRDTEWPIPNGQCGLAPRSPVSHAWWTRGMPRHRSCLAADLSDKSSEQKANGSIPPVTHSITRQTCCLPTTTVHPIVTFGVLHL